MEPNSEYQYYHNHIFDQGIAFVPQMGAFAVWGGNVPNKNPYNAAHTRGSPMYTSKHFSIIDVRRFGFVDAPLGYNVHELARANSMPQMSADEMFAERVAREHRELQKLLGDENETRDGIKSIEFIGRVLIEQEARVTEEEDDDGFSRDAPIKSYEQDCCEDAAPNCLEVPSEVPKEHIRIDDEDGFRRPSSEPTILPPRPKERVPLQYLEGDAKSDFRRYGMPAVTKGSVFEMVNCSFQPRMRYGHQMFVHRTRVLITGGRLSYADDDDEVGELPPAVFDLSNREWKEPARWRDSEGRDIDARTVTGSRIFRAAYTQMFRHSSDDEATCFMWGGIDENVEGGRENTNLLIGWIKPKPVEPPNLSMRPPAVSLVEPLFHFEALPIAEGPRPEWELGTFQSKPTAANEVRKGAFLVALNMMPPPSRLEYAAMKEGTARHAGSESHLDTVWEVLFLFKSNGEVWELPLSARAIRDRTLRWRRTTLHFGLPAALATAVVVDDTATQQPAAADAANALAVSYIESHLKDTHLLGVVPRNRFSYNIVPKDLYGPAKLAGPAFGKRDNAMQSVTEFILVCQDQKRGPSGKYEPVNVPRTTTFLPLHGHAVNDVVRVRLPRKVAIHGTALMTPHFLRPRPVANVEVPASDSRYIYDTNIEPVDSAKAFRSASQSLTRFMNPKRLPQYKLKTLPPHRTFSGFVNATYVEGERPQDGQPISTYLSKAPTTLLEMVSQVVVRFFTETELAVALERRNARVQIATI